MEPTETLALGRTDLRVSRLGLGTVPIGGLYEAVEETEAVALVRHAVRFGVRLLDTAPVYGLGLAEQRLGSILSHLPREAITLSTKVGRLLRADAPPDPGLMRDGRLMFQGAPALNPVWDFSADGVRRSLEESLTRLQVDRLDIVHVHDPDEHFDEAVRGAFPALMELRAQGVIRAVGSGMNQAGMLSRFARELDVDCLLLAGRYTLLDQCALDELLPTCEERGVALIVGGVFNSGILARPRAGATYDYTRASPAVLERARRLAAVCAQYDVPLAAAAIQFPFGHPAVATVLAGMRSVNELEENIELLRCPIPSDLWAALRAEGLLDERAPTPATAIASDHSDCGAQFDGKTR